MKRRALEPGILQIFILFVAFRTVLFVLGFIASLFYDLARFPVGLDLLFWVSIVNTFLLLLYLLWNWPRKKLGFLYFPIAIIVVTFGTILESYLYLLQQTEEIVSFGILFQPFIYLFLPLVLIAWQYDLVVVVIFSIGTAFLDTLFRMTMPISGMISYVHIGLVFTRTVTFLFVGYMVSRLVALQRAQKQALAEANQALQKANMKLVQHAATIEQLSISQERNRMAREIHDVVAHTLSGLAVQLDAVTSLWQSIPKKAEDMLQGALQLTRSGLDETRRAMQNLRSSPLEELGLGLAIRTLAEDAAERAVFQLQHDIQNQFDNLTPDLEQCYYRVAQEAFENIVCHANASVVQVSLKCLENNKLVLSIHDDGQGFKNQRDEFGDQFGIIGMQERADLIGAELVVESKDHQGTSVILRWEEKA